ncbi:MAG: aminotransferase class I/II-fold pyridoxal phosphate-dependent enzyme [Acidobacteria bacterium]|nr:aminotransferase class I/II-fold pyridoxal phosphate-dependent enzyme [Acidobacteriota bacterium]
MTTKNSMKVSRRTFVKTTGIGVSAAAIMAYDGPRSIARAWSMSLPQEERPMLLHNNENPLGPGRKVVEAMNEALSNGRGGRYPGSGGLPEALARAGGIPQDNLMIGNGSTQLLRTCTQVFTSPTRPLVTGAPSYEECAQYANNIGHPVEEVLLDDHMMLDLNAMADASQGAGMVFLNNPNNPTGTLWGADAVGSFIERVRSESPETMIVVDEAYHDYVTEPSHSTQIPRALSDTHVIVARTFSKAHGMAGMRIGWVVAHPDAISKMREWHLGLTLNIPSLLGAATSILDRERIEEEVARNTAARAYTIDWFEQHGMDATDSQCNFIFARTGMNAQEFRSGCAARNIRVGRNFPPYQEAWARISISTIEDMRTATRVFGEVLGVQAKAEAA